MSVAIECSKRPEGKTPNAMRREGLVPVTIYGHKGAESEALTVKLEDAAVLLRSAAVNRTVVDVSAPELAWQGKALIREAQFHPWKALLYHLSFFVVDNQEKVNTIIPIRLVGESQAVKQGSKLRQAINTIKVHCPPDLIPEEVTIDMTALGSGSRVLVSDLELPEGVEPTSMGSLTILAISG